MEKTELVSRYLDGEMSAGEQAQFLNDLQNNLELREELNLQKHLVATLKSQKNIELKNKLLAHAEQKSKRNKVYYNGIAASIAALVIFGLWLFRKPSKDLFLTHYESYPSLFTTRGTQGRSEAFEAYSEGNFEKALSLFLTDTIKDDTTQFYLGLSYIELGNLEQAEENLDELPSNSIFYPQRTWYLGLIYLRADKRSEAKEVLIQIKEGEYKYESAQEILGDLD